jgi:hypothetical protein
MLLFTRAKKRTYFNMEENKGMMVKRKKEM